MTPGVYANITNADYHGGPGVSKSMLDVLAEKSPLHLHYLRTQANDNDKQPTPAQMIGTAFHALLLEPAEFVKDYCLGLRREDVPEAIEDRDVLLAMVADLNKSRLPKLTTGGSKDELVARIEAAEREQLDAALWSATDALQALKLPELKERIAALNEKRPGLLTTTNMNRNELADLLRAHGKQVTLWSDVQAEWLQNNGHRTVLNQDQWDQLHQMRDAVMAHPAARALLSVPGWAELSVYWNDPVTGELCRCRPDFWRQDGVLVDLKTTEDASADEFARSIANWRYHVQHPFYVDGVTEALKQASAKNLAEAFGVDNTQPSTLPPPAPPAPKAFVFLAVEKTACVVNGQAKGVAVYSLDAESVALGRVLYRADLNTYADCNATGVWPGYGDKIQNIKVPAWEFQRNADLIAAA